MKYIKFICVATLLQFGCSDKKPLENLVPQEPGPAPNYWCTWYWQNYLIEKGKPVSNPDAREVFSNQASRDQLTEETVFGDRGMAQVMLPYTRSDYYFLIDHGWQDKRIKQNTFFTGIMDTTDFPRYAHLEPKDRIKEFNRDIKKLGWRGLGLWFRGNPSKEKIRELVEWSKYAGVEYWKIDGGDTQNFFASSFRDEIYPDLVLEHISGAGPVNPKWDTPGLEYYPSVYSNKDMVSQDLQEGTTLNKKSQKVEHSLNIIRNTDVFRTYDAAPLLVSTTTMQRIHDLLIQTAGKSEFNATLNIQDDCYIAAAMGLLVAVKRHPMNTPRMYKGKDFHLQISGDRHVDKRLNEMDRLALWQRIAPPMNAGYGTYNYAEENYIDSIVFEENHTWFKPSHGKMVRQSAPAVMSRNISLPEVKGEGYLPYVMASKFPNGAIAIATEGRVSPEKSWIEPLADIKLKEVKLETPIGVFGYYRSLRLEFDDSLPQNLMVLAQDLLAKAPQDISEEVEIESNSITLPGELIERIGTLENDEGDISAPGLVLKVIHDE